MLELSTFTLKESIRNLQRSTSFSMEEIAQHSSPFIELWSEKIPFKVQLINDLESVNWGEPTLQFQICDYCRYPGCQDQGWVELKRSNDFALITPALTKIENTADDLKEIYYPPSYLSEVAIAIHSKNYAQLRQFAPFPDFETLSPLLGWEAVKIFQLEAPGQILGEFRNPPKFDRDLILASSEGSFIEQNAELISLLKRLQKLTHPVELRKVTERDRIISFYLDIAAVSQWEALVYDGKQYSLYLKPGYVIENSA